MLTRHKNVPVPPRIDAAQAALKKRALEKTLRQQGLSRSAAKKFVARFPPA